MYPDQNRPDNYPRGTGESPRVTEWPPKDKPPMPDFANQPLIVTKPKSPNRKIFLIAAAIMVALLGFSALAYAVYNQPSRVLGDAISKMFTEKSGNVKGEANITSEGQSGDIKIGFDITSDEKIGKADLMLTANAAPITFDMSGSVISTAEGDIYFKIDKAKEIMRNFIGANPQAFEKYGSLLELIDNKWVKVNAKEISNDAAASECVQNLLKEASENSNLSGEIKKTYANNQFITVDKNLAPESINGVDSIHYKVIFNEDRISNFVGDFKQTDLYKKLVDCDSSIDLDMNDAVEFAKEANELNIEVWIGRWAHKLTKIKVNGTEGGSNFEVAAETKWNQPVNAEVPAEFTPWERVTEEFQKVLQESFMPARPQLQTLQPAAI